METEDEIQARYLSLRDDLSDFAVPDDDSDAESPPVLFFPKPPERRRGGRPKGSKNKVKPIDKVLQATPDPPAAPAGIAHLPPPPVQHKHVKAPVTTLEGQTQWYMALLNDEEVPIKEKREAMRELADLHGLKKAKDLGNMATKTTEELQKLLREVLEIWKIAGVLQVVDPGGEDSYLRN